MSRHHYTALLQALQNLADPDQDLDAVLADIQLNAHDVGAAMRVDANILDTSLRDHIDSDMDRLRRASDASND